jgi:putative addiction module killer protein
MCDNYIVMLKKEIRYYIAPNGKKPVIDWLSRFKDKTTQAKIYRRLERLALGQYGDYKSLGDGVYELRLTFGAGYRVYFANDNDVVIILLCGGDKSTQAKDIKLAKQFWRILRGN